MKRITNPWAANLQVGREWKRLSAVCKRQDVASTIASTVASTPQRKELNGLPNSDLAKAEQQNSDKASCVEAPSWRVNKKRSFYSKRPPAFMASTTCHPKGGTATACTIPALAVAPKPQGNSASAFSSSPCSSCFSYPSARKTTPYKALKEAPLILGTTPPIPCPIA